MGGHMLAEQCLGIGHMGAPRAMPAAARREGLPAKPPTDEADQPGRENDDRKRNSEGEDGDEGGRGHAGHPATADRAASNPAHGLQHDRQHRGLEPEEQGLDRADIAKSGIEPGQDHDRREAWQHEQRAGDEAALGPVQQPADIGRELLRLRARQKHAVIERVQETRVADPPFLLDEDAVHEGDLTGRPAEAQQRDPRPDPNRLGQGHCRCRILQFPRPPIARQVPKTTD